VTFSSLIFSSFFSLIKQIKLVFSNSNIVGILVDFPVPTLIAELIFYFAACIIIMTWQMTQCNSVVLPFSYSIPNTYFLLVNQVLFYHPARIKREFCFSKGKQEADKIRKLSWNYVKFESDVFFSYSFILNTVIWGDFAWFFVLFYLRGPLCDEIMWSIISTCLST
jgi:hypothetical protein